MSTRTVLSCQAFRLAPLLASAARHRVLAIDLQEARMALVRVVSFDGVTRERLQEQETQMRDSEPPEGLPAKEIMVLHDADAEKALVMVFFDSEEDYQRGDEVLSAMPAGDTPGRRTDVAKYDVAIRMSAGG